MSDQELSPEQISAARLGAWLQSTREAKGLSRRDVAARSGVAAWRLRAWESGVGRPDPGRLEALLAALGSTLDDLYPPRVPFAFDALEDGSTGGSLSQVVARMRQSAPGGLPTLRRADLEALAERIGSDPTDIELRIVALTRCSPFEAEAIRRRLVEFGLLDQKISGTP